MEVFQGELRIYQRAIEILLYVCSGSSDMSIGAIGMFTMTHVSLLD